MKTYLSVWFNSNGNTPSEITKKLEKLGFKPMRGNYDYYYEWGINPGVNDVLSLGDNIQKTLKGANLHFKLETA